MRQILTIDKVTLQLAFNQQLDTFNSNYIVNKFRTKGNAFVVNSEIQLIKTQRLEKYYLHTYAVYYNESQVATLSTDCRQHGQRDSIKLQLSNYLFYTNPGWHYYCEKILKALDMSFKSLSQLELSLDIQSNNPIIPQLALIWKRSTFLKHNDEIIYSPLDGKLKCTPHDGESYYFGSSSVKKENSSKKRGSGKTIKVYDKTDEIKANNNEKEYITKYYDANDFDTSKTIERIEAKLEGKWLSKFPIDLLQLTEASFLEKLFVTAVANTFKFRKLDSEYYDGNRNKKIEVITLIDFSNLNSQPLHCKPVSNNISGKELSKRGAVKYAVREYIITGSPQYKEFLQLHIASIAAPQGTNWPNLLAKYAKEYEGRVTDEIEKRINEFR